MNTTNTTETQLEFDFMKPEQLAFDFTNTSVPMMTLKPNYNVSFHKDDIKIGELDWNDGIMKFKGDADESAQLFFDNIIKRYFQTQLDLKKDDGSYE